MKVYRLLSKLLKYLSNTLVIEKKQILQKILSTKQQDSKKVYLKLKLTYIKTITNTNKKCCFVQN